MIKRILNSRFLPPGALCYRHKALETLGYTTILVYTMGKVGSSSVYYSLRNYNISPLIYHVHFLTDSNLKRVTEKYNNSPANLPDKISINQLLKNSTHHITASFALNKAAQSEIKKWKIITLVRDPVATFLSHVFQTPETHRPYLLGQDGSLDREKVKSYIHDYYISFDHKESSASDWFVTEFSTFTGIDLYNHPFDRETGYSIIQDNRFDIAVLTLESLERNFAKVVGKLIDSKKTMSVKKKNVRENQKGADLYKDLTRNIIVPREGLEKVYSTRYAKHFYSQEFREKMIEKWSNPR